MTGILPTGSEMIDCMFGLVLAEEHVAKVVVTCRTISEKIKHKEKSDDKDEGAVRVSESPV